MKTVEGYILRTIDYKETSKLLYLYTNEGLLSMVARGVKKMQSAYRHIAQSGMHVKVTLTDGKLPTLKEAELINHYPTIKKHIERVHIMYTVHDYLLYNIHDQDDHKKMFQFLLKVLNRLETSEYSHELLCIFELKLLHFLGVGMNFKACAVCNTLDNLVFDLHTSSVYCSTHADSKHSLYDASVTKQLRHFYYCDVLTYNEPLLTTHEVQLLYAITDALYSTHLGFKSRAKTILQTLL